MKQLDPEWVKRFTAEEFDDPIGCPACGAMAGCCSKYPNCPGNPDFKPTDSEDV